MSDPSLDCRSVQASCGLPGAFDARSVCHKVLVPFDRKNNNVLGGSKEPYLNNPLRIPAVIAAHRGAQKDKDGFDDLCLVLDDAQADPAIVPLLFRVLLLAIRDRLATVAVTYPVPNRMSLTQTQALMSEFLRVPSGGLRLQAVACALFQCVGERCHLFAQVRSANINAADASTGVAADLECLDRAGSVVLAVEVKDRQLTLREVQDKLPTAREKGIKELVFLITGGIGAPDKTSLRELVDREFVTGQNVYVCDFRTFLESCLVLFGESGRRVFLQRIGEELERRKADISHRRAWAALLRGV